MHDRLLYPPFPLLTCTGRIYRDQPEESRQLGPAQHPLHTRWQGGPRRAGLSRHGKYTY